MAAIERLEHLLAQALQCLDDAAWEVRCVPELPGASNLKRIGAAIVSAWEVRDEVHRLRPDLRPVFVVELAEDKARYEILDQIADVAYQNEIVGDVIVASASYRELYDRAVTGYFRMVAEAGLFRLLKA